MKKLLLLLFVMCPFLTAITQTMNTDSLRRLLASAKEDSDKARLFFYLSAAYVFEYADTSVEYAKQGLKLAEKAGDKRWQAGCMTMMALGLTNQGNFAAGLNFGFKALALSESIGDSSMLVYMNNNLMKCYAEQEDYKEALIYGYRAKSFLASPTTTKAQASLVQGILGGVYEKLNQFDSALYYLQRSYDLTQLYSEVLISFGNIYLKKSDYAQALKYYREGIAIAKVQLTFTNLVVIYNSISKVYERTGNKDSAIYYAMKSFTQEGIHAYPEGKLQAASQLAHLYETRGNADSIIKYQQLAIDLKDSLFNRQKTREAQNFAFNAKLQEQELEAQRRQDESKTRMIVLLAAIIIFLMIVFILWRNNNLKQKAYALLQHKNEEIESTLSELKATQAQLIQSEKMASLGELTAGIAHEIQNPLNFVNNFSDLNAELIDELRSERSKVKSERSEELEEEILNDIQKNEQKINHHGKRADAIVKGMLQHSRSSSGVKEPTDINKLADEYLRLAYHGLRAKDKSFNATLKTDFDESIGNINIIPQDIGSVLLNLINNAFYAVTEKKQQHGESYEPTVSVSTKKINGLVEIKVADNGDGIPQKIVDKIFQPFFTTKPTGEGTGLGLSLSYDIIKAHGGELNVETKEGEFAQFTVRLPS